MADVTSEMEQKRIQPLTANRALPLRSWVGRPSRSNSCAALQYVSLLPCPHNLYRLNPGPWLGIVDSWTVESLNPWIRQSLRLFLMAP